MSGAAPAQPANATMIDTKGPDADKNSGNDDEWGDFDQYEDPNDVQFPTLTMSDSVGPTLESQPSVDNTNQDSSQTAPTGAQQDFPKVTNLDDLMSLMQTTSAPKPAAAQIQADAPSQPATGLDLFDIG